MYIIPPGKFTWGTTADQRARLLEQHAWTRFEECERPDRQVTISQPFLIGRFESATGQLAKDRAFYDYPRR